MQTKTEIARTLEHSDQEAAYDEVVKRLLSTRYLLAWIMKGCVAEYKDYSIQEIVDNFIEGEPLVSSAPVHRNESIHGLDTVDKSRAEHTTLYDVLFHATLPDSDETIGLFINVETQNKYNPG